jgi:AraC-like DNA-binding protein
MFNITFKLDDLNVYAQQLADEMGVPLENNYIKYREDLATGGSYFVDINEYIQIQVASYKAKKHLYFHKLPSSNNNIVISLQDFTFAPCPEHGSSCNEIIANNKSIGSIQCKSTKKEETIIIEPNVEINILVIHLKENWEHYILKDEAAKAKLYNYLVKDNANLRIEYLNAERNKIFKEILKGCTQNAVQSLFYHSKIFALLENFFVEIINAEEKDESLHVSSNDVAMIQLAEEYIIENVAKPFPSVEELAKIACMSRTKFINLFQKIYNISSYEYYQKKRLSKAYSLILDSEKSLTEIAQYIGYTGVQNFSTAFEKEFGLHPKTLKKSKEESKQKAFNLN